MQARIVAALALLTLLTVGLLGLAQTTTTTHTEPTAVAAFAASAHENGMGVTAFTGSITAVGHSDLALWGGEGARFDWPGTSLRNYVITWTGDATDPRLSGVGQQTVSAEYVFSDDGYTMTAWAPYAITNDHGRWEGTASWIGTWSTTAPTEQPIAGDVMLLGRDGYDGLLAAMHVECMGDTTDHYDCTMAGWIEPIFTEAEIEADWAERPLRIDGSSWVTDVELAGEPFVDTSTFDGRCSAPAYWVFHGAFEGVSSQFGPVTGTNSHCFHDYNLSDGIVTLTLADGTTINEAYAGHAIVKEDWSGWWLGRMTVTDATGRLVGANGTTIDRHIYADVTTYMPDFGPGDEMAWLESEGRIGVRPSMLMTRP